jgi:uncharacterized protein (TIGR02996 family)
MSTATLPEAVRTDLTIRRDLRPDDVRGFLTDLWREPDGHDAALIFADWLEDQGDARTQPVRWSVLRENCYTEQIRDAYRSRMTDWWLRHGRAWVGPVPSHQRLHWHRGCLSTTIHPTSGRDPTASTAALQAIRSLRQAIWIGQLELDTLSAGGILHDIGPNLSALSVRHCLIAALDPLERATGLRQLQLRYYARPQAALGRLPALQVLEMVESSILRELRLHDLPELVRFEPVECPALVELRVERIPKLTALSLSPLPGLRRLDLADLPTLERLDVPESVELHIHDCPRLPPDQIAALVARHRRLIPDLASRGRQPPVGVSPSTGGSRPRLA